MAKYEQAYSKFIEFHDSNDIINYIKYLVGKAKEMTHDPLLEC